MTSTDVPGGPVRRAGGTPFVGRRAELAVVDEAWARACGGAPGVVWIEGAAGSGKTALLTRCLERLRPATVLAAVGDPAESSLHHGVLDQLVAGLPPGGVDRHPLLGPGRAPGADPFTVGAELLAVLGSPDEDLAGTPVLIVVDDVQWADPASVQALAFVLRRLRHDRVLVLVGQRDEDGSGAVASWPRLLAAGRETARRVRLEGLGAGEVSELAAAIGRPLGSTSAADRLHHHTRGHPLHTRALLEELSPEVLAGTGDVLPAPRSLQAVVLVRLSRAPAAARDLVVAASVLGETCALGLAAAVAGLTDPTGALDAAVACGLLEEPAGAAPGRVAFTHPLVRAAVHGDLPPRRRRELHALAARLLSGRAALDHRIAAAAGPDPALAAEIDAIVADPAAPPPPAEAADLLRIAADLDTDPDRRERRQARAVACLLAAGEIARALAMEPVADAWRSGPRRSAVLGQLALLSGRFGSARERLDAATASGECGDGAEAGEERAVALAHRALLHAVEGEPTAAVDRAGTALATPAGRRRAVRLPAGMALVLGLATSGRQSEARGVLAAASGTSGSAPVDVLVARGVLDALRGADAEAERHLLAAVRRARTGEPVRAPALALAFLPAVQDRLGSGDGAGARLEAAELAVAVARDGGTALPGTLARAFVAEMLALRGRGDDARAHLAVAHDTGPHWWGGATCLAVAGAVLAEAEHDAEGMLRALAPALDPHVRSLTDGLGMLAPRVLEVDALVGLGRREAAVDALASLTALLAGRPPDRHALDAARLGLLLDARAPDPAARTVAELAPELAAVRAPLARARLEIEIAHRLLVAGERRAGVDLLRTARDRAVRSGAAPWRHRCEALLHDAGLTPPGTEDALGLTGHEHAVVALVARGLTNREVGLRLFVTPRTVAYHLSNVYAKLGVTSRRELRERMAALVDA